MRPLRARILPQRSPRVHWLLRITGSLLLAGLLSGALVAIGVAGMTVSSAPRWISLSIEPFSFFLLPGALYAWVQAGLLKIDFSSTTVIHANLLFYFAVFALLLLLRLRSARQSRPAAPARSR